VFINASYQTEQRRALVGQRLIIGIHQAVTVTVKNEASFSDRTRRFCAWSDAGQHPGHHDQCCQCAYDQSVPQTVSLSVARY